jgi:hypothetical protein
MTNLLARLRSLIPGREPLTWDELQRILDAAEPYLDRRPASRSNYQEIVGAWYAEGLSPEEWAARHGHELVVSSFSDYEFDDPLLDAWSQRLATLLFTAGAVDVCRRHFLSRRQRRHVEWHERQEL